MTQPEPQTATAPPVTIVNKGKGPGTLGSIIVAVIAIIGTVAGGAITGYYSYETTSHNTDTQRFSQLEDQRRATYSAFLSSATQLCVGLQTGAPMAKIVPLLSDMTDKEATVLLISPAHLQAPTEQLHGYMTEQANTYLVNNASKPACDSSRFGTLRDAFVNAAKQDFPDTY
jgi:hypothetical protein